MNIKIITKYIYMRNVYYKVYCYLSTYVYTQCTHIVRRSPTSTFLGSGPLYGLRTSTETQLNN